MSKYKGGQLVGPVLGNFGDLGKMLLEGTNQINAIKEGVEKSRAEESSALAKQISDISSTGLETYDKLIGHGTRLLRDEYSKEVQKNKLGLSTRTKASMVQAKGMTQASLLTNSTRIINEKLEAYDKGIKDLSISGLTKSDYLSAWYTDKSLLTDEYDSDGVMLKSKDNLRIDIVDGELRYFKTVKKGDKQAVISKSLTDMASTSIKPRYYYDVPKEVKDFKDSIGDQVTYYTPSGGLGSVPSFNVQGQTPNGSSMLTQVVNPQSYGTIVAAVEKQLESITPERATVILYDNLGARNIFHPDYKVSTEEEWKSKFGDRDVMIDGKLEKVPLFYSQDYKSLEFTKDPLSLNYDNEGTSISDKEQVELAKAYMRKKYLDSMGITAKNILDHKKGGAKKITELDNVAVKRYTKTLDENKNIISTPMNMETLRGLYAVQKYSANPDTLKFATKAKESMSKGQSYILGFNYDEQKTLGKLKSNDPLETVLNSQYYKPVSAMLGQFDSETFSKKMGGFTLNNGTKITKVTGMTVVEPEIGSRLPYRLIIQGDASFSESSDDEKFSSGSGTNSENKIQSIAKRSITGEGLTLVTSAKAAEIYKTLWNSNPLFRQAMETARFDENGSNEVKSLSKRFERAISLWINKTK